MIAMEQPEQFTCSVCDITFDYKYHGRHLDGIGIKDIELLEEAFVIQDPFVPTRDFLVLGGHCSTWHYVTMGRSRYTISDRWQL
uniref:Cysteine-rich DPF motif domain-containing protein 1 n=1 Tax=Ciona intestinalis TaxID=7719 RepID=H2XVR4_CIOIN